MIKNILLYPKFPISIDDCNQQKFSVVDMDPGHDIEVVLALRKKGVLVCCRWLLMRKQFFFDLLLLDSKNRSCTLLNF